MNNRYGYNILTDEYEVMEKNEAMEDSDNADSTSCKDEVVGNGDSAIIHHRRYNILADE